MTTDPSDILVSLYNEDTNNVSTINFFNDLSNRIYWIDSEIDNSYLELIQYIYNWNREDMLIPPENRKPIRLLFHSPGGDLDLGEALYNAISMSTTPVYGIAVGMVASAASLIYMACHKRYAFPNAYFLIHHGAAGMQGNYSDIINLSNDYQKQIEKMEKYYLSHLTMDADEFKKNIEHDWYVRDEDRLKFGFVEEILNDFSILM